ncbi:MAG: DUF4417 domain-containing protein [Firmicutes bacterium]|nr:DUF4417 domain-containing protein [Bacillota bacterium]
MTDFIRQPRLDVYKSWLVENADFSADMEFPMLKRVDFQPERAIPFDKAIRAGYHRQWVHFYTHKDNRN